MSTVTPIYDLQIVQEPVRARMCGLGDKDRRQITPPPFIKLIIKNPENDEAVDIESIDITNFVLIVELWTVDEKDDLTLNQIIESGGSRTSSSSAASIVRPFVPSNRSSNESDEEVSQKMISDDVIEEEEEEGQGEHQGDVIAEEEGEVQGEGVEDVPKNEKADHKSPSEHIVTSLEEREKSFKEEEGSTSTSRILNLSSLIPEKEDHQKSIGSGTPDDSELAQSSSVSNKKSMSSITPKPTTGTASLSTLGAAPEDTTITTSDLGTTAEDPTVLDPNVSPTSKSTSSSDSDESLGDIPTRNLIGSLVVNPYKLYDDKLERGIWFILQDLSVRIEGEFRLKLNFIDINSNTTVHKFSQPFKVYSAKKFPGVVDSSPLGKVFASQGVKISIRREAKSEKSS